MTTEAFHKKPNPPGMNRRVRAATIWPRDRTVSARKDKPVKTAKTKYKRNVIRGKEVSVRLTADNRQIVYGKMKIGGTVTYVDTSQNSAAYFISGSDTDQNQIVFTARTFGEPGNAITIELVATGTAGSITVTVIGNAIKIRVKSTSGTPLSTIVEVITAVRANGAANALVSTQRLVKDDVGVAFPFDPTPLNYGGGKWLHQIITLAGHHIDGVQTIYLGNEAVTFGDTPDPRWGTGKFKSKVFASVMIGTDDQPAQPDLMGQKPGVWTATDRQAGCALVYMILVWNQNLFPTGLPEISFLMRGKYCYDPRSDMRPSGYYWTQNAALIWSEFYTNKRYGFGVDYSLIDLPTLIQAANDCDDLIETAGGGYEPRYQINGVFDSAESLDTIHEEILAAMGGDMVISGNKRYLYVAKYRTPHARVITQDDLRGAINLKTHISRSETFNCIHGTYVNPNDDYKEADIPAIKNSTYITQDGGVERWQDNTLNFVTSSGQAQRLLKIELERMRQGQTMKLPLNIVGLNYRAGDNVSFYFPEIFGELTKVWEVIETDIILNEDGTAGVDLTLKETAPGIFDWNHGEETVVDLAQNTGLPRPDDVTELVNLVLESGTDQLDVRQDGSVLVRVKVSWDNPITEFVSFGGSIEVQFKKHADTDYRPGVIVGGADTFCYLNDVQDGIYIDVRARAINSVGYQSDWTYALNHFVVGKTAPPSDVTGFTVTKNAFGIKFVWDDITDTDKKDYSIHLGGADFDSGTEIYRGKTTNFTWEFKTAGTYAFRIKAYDTSDNPSTNAAGANITIIPPTPPILSLALEGENIILSWTVPSASDFAIKEYELRDVDLDLILATITGRVFRYAVNWGGDKNFSIKARDVAGNTSTAGTAFITIDNPNPAQDFSATAISNNVILDWKTPVLTSLPVNRYLLYKGPIFADAALLGDVDATFNTYVESVGGAFVYWLVSVDSAGNRSTPVSAGATVSQPQDFYIKSDIDLMEEGYLINSQKVIFGGSSYLEDELPGAYLPVASTIIDTAGLPLLLNTEHERFLTLADWLALYGFATEQDAIDAGYTTTLAPSTLDPGYMEFKVDYELLFSKIFISFNWEEQVIGGSVSVVPSIKTSADDITYSTFTNASQVFGTNVRYVIFRLDFQANDLNSVSRLFNFKSVLSLQIVEEYGDRDVYAADAGGTRLYFTKTFLDIQNLLVSVQGTVARIHVENFVDIPNPLFWDQFLFDKDGNRVNGKIRYRAIGAQ